MAFKDHFSHLAADYHQFRPRYPPELGAWLAGAAPGPGVALDLATGNGQAAVALAGHFARVIASDASASQLAHARPHPRVSYLRHPAECLPVRSGSIDVVAVAQAAHWFDLERFYPEARRVLKPSGLVALWTYDTFRIDDPVDRLVDAFYSGVVGRYWPPERRHVEQGYRTLPFPFAELPAPAFVLATEWTLAQLVGYLSTWSAVDRYRAATGADPLPRLTADLASVWPQDAPRRVHWPLHLRIGRV